MPYTLIDQLFPHSAESTIPLIITKHIPLEDLTPFQQRWLRNRYDQDGTLKANQFCIIPDDSGTIAQVYAGYNPAEPTYTLGEAAHTLPAGDYRLQIDADLPLSVENAMIGFGLGAYQFNRYKSEKTLAITLYHEAADREAIQRALHAHYLVRNLINEPPNRLTPDNFSTLIKAELSDLPIHLTEWVGDALIKNNFPLIYTVGAGSCYKPRLIEVLYEPDDAENSPHITLVGKGVCFDTGGLDIKPSSGMRLMKKDMGGAAHMLALAKWLIEEKAPLNLRLLLPIVENSVSGAAMRPGDIIKARNGLTVEVDNTDAEGRLILADALSYASEKQTDLIINFATLTGAARVALGPEIPALFSNNDQIAQILEEAGREHDDLLCRLPLHPGYQSWIEPEIADLANSAAYPFAGAITAALFLQKFIDHERIPFAHIDLMAWNIRPRSGRPKGGEAMGLHAAYHGIHSYLAQRSSN